METVENLRGLLIAALAAAFAVMSCGAAQREYLDQLPEYRPEDDIPNRHWVNEERIVIRGYDGHAMEVGLSPDAEYLLFNDRRDPDKDMHWSRRVDDRTYEYGGRVDNTVSDRIDATPSFDGEGNLYFTTLKDFPRRPETVFVAGFRNGVALDPAPVVGDIYVPNRDLPNRVWISLDPDVSGDGRFLFYSEGLFNPRVGLPYPYNVRGAERFDGRFVKMQDRILENVNTDALEYAPAISDDGLEIFFTRIAKVAGRPKMLGIYTARRAATEEPFGQAEHIEAITGDVEAPTLTADEQRLYYHRMVDGRFAVFRVTRRPPPP